MDESQGNNIGRFEVLRKLGAGGMGEVYAARDPQLKRDVAIKRLPRDTKGDDKWRERMLREARSAARITHQHVAALYDVHEDEGETYLVMELVDGDTLRQLDLPLDEQEFLDIAKQCAAGVAAAHRQGVVHGDIKPDNVMLSREGEAKILDFGVAGLMMTAGGDATTAFDTLAVAPGSAGHTVAYAAPEVLRGRPADARADLFSLGIVFYELLAGTHPFADDTPTAIAGRVLHEDPVPLDEANPQVSQALTRIVGKLLAKAPRDRYATADDLLVDLRGASTLHDTGAAMARRAVRRRTSRLWGWRGAVAALGVVAFLTAPFWSRYLPWQGPAGVPADRFDASEWIIAVVPAGAYDEEQDELRVLNTGLASTLTTGLTRLSQAHELQVVPASSLYEREATSLEAARREFGVTLALTFDTQIFGDAVRVNANLVDLTSQRQLAAETVDGTLEDLLGLQERVSRRVLRMLRLELRPMEQEYLQAGTQEPRAYRYYIQGIGYLEDRTSEDDVDAAVELFEQALRVDPNFAAAHAGLGQGLWLRYQRTLEPRWVDEAMVACTEATTLDEFEAAGHVCLGRLLLGTGQAEQAVTRFERAIDLDPTRDDAIRGLANAYERLNRRDLAEETYRDAIEMRPHYWSGYTELGVFYYAAGDYDRAIENLEEVVRLAPDSYAGFSDLGAALYQAGRWVQARRAFERALELYPDDARSISNLGTLEYYEHNFQRAADLFARAVELRPRASLAWGGLAETLRHLEGPTDRANAALAEALALTEAQLEVDPSDPWSRADRAVYRAWAGETDALAEFAVALAAAPGDPEMLLIGARVAVLSGDLERSLDYLEESLAGGTALRIVEREPTFEPLAASPRWQSIVGSDEAAQ